MDQKHGRGELTVPQTVPSLFWACDYISWHPLHLAVTMWVSASPWDVSGSDMCPSTLSPRSPPYMLLYVLVPGPQLDEDKPCNLRNHVEDGRATRSNVSVPNHCLERAHCSSDTPVPNRGASNALCLNYSIFLDVVFTVVSIWKSWGFWRILWDYL